MGVQSVNGEGICVHNSDAAAGPLLTPFIHSFQNVKPTAGYNSSSSIRIVKTCFIGAYKINN